MKELVIILRPLLLVVCSPCFDGFVIGLSIEFKEELESFPLRNLCGQLCLRRINKLFNRIKKHSTWTHDGLLPSRE